MAAASNIEQYILELINDARLDPLGNAARYISSYSPLTSSDPDIQAALSFFQVNGTALLNAYQALTPVKPLAWSSTLNAAAAGHNAQMIAADSQSHQLPGEASLGTRATNAGYVGWNGVGENIFAYADSALYGHAGFMVDWGSGPNGMQNPAGHRINIMSSTFREVGISATTETNPATGVGPLVITQDFGYRSGGPQVFVLGVAFTDSDHNRFYTPGEGLGTLSVSVSHPGGIAATTSATSGGYSVGVASGLSTITLTGGGLAGATTVQGTFATGTNVKIDVVDGTTIRVSESVIVGGAATRIEVLGVTGLSLTGDGSAQTMIGTKGNDILQGVGGSDYLDGGSGVDAQLGGAGNDTIVWDAADDLANVLGGADTDTLLVLSGAAPTGFDLASHGFEIGRVEATDTGGQSWASYYRLYAPGWAQTQQFTTYDNGTSIRIGYSGGLQDWQQENRIDGTLQYYTDWDQALNQTWSQTVEYYAANGTTRTQKLTNYDNGTSIRVGYDAAGNPDWQQEMRANGTLEIYTDWDQAGNQTWTQTVEYYAADGTTRTQKNTTYDNGTSIRVGYDTHGHADWQEERRADATLQYYTDWDQDDASSVNYFIRYYAANGATVTGTHIFYDNGTDVWV